MEGCYLLVNNTQGDNLKGALIHFNTVPGWHMCKVFAEMCILEKLSYHVWCYSLDDVGH